MKHIFLLIALFTGALGTFAQHVMKLHSDSVVVSNTTGSGELVLRNSTQQTQGVLFNKGNGVTEFRALKFIRVGDSTLVILGQDTTSIVGGAGNGSVFLGDPDILLSVSAYDANNMLLRWWKTDADLYQSARIGVIGDSQGKGDFPSEYKYSIIGRLQTFLYSVGNNIAITNYCQNGYNSRKLAPTGSNQYVDNLNNVTKALNDGNKIIILCNTSNDFSPNGAGGIVPLTEAMENTMLIADACAKAGATLFVISSFPRTELSTAQREEINKMASLLNQKFGSRCAYVYRLLEDPANPNQLNPSLQTGDNIHLNDAGAGIVYSAVRDMLTSYFTSNTNISKYQVQKAGFFNGAFTDHQFYTQPNNPSGIIPSDSNFYRVRLVYNNGYYSKWSNTVQGILGRQDIIVNKPPLLAITAPQIVLLPNTSVTLTANASAQNPGGTIASYEWFRIVGNVATIASPSAATTNITGLAEGTYVFRCKATDNEGLASFADAMISVQLPNQSNLASKFNFNLTPQNVSGWVDVSDGPLAAVNNGKVWTENLHNISLVNISNATSHWGQNFFNGNADNANGSNVADGGGYVIPQNAILSGWYSNNMGYTGTSSSQLKLTGLDPAKSYKIKVYSSLASSFGLDANPTICIVKDNVLNQKQVDAVGNTSNVMIFRGIVPLTNGEIPLFIGSEPGQSQFGMINALTVEEDVAEPSPIAPSVLSAGDKTIQAPASTTTIAVTASDVDGELISAAWTQVSGPNTATIASSTALKTAIANLVAGTYVFRCTVTDNNSATGHADVTVTVTPVSTNPTLSVAVSKFNFTEPGWTVLVGEPHANELSVQGTLASSPVTISSVSTSNWSALFNAYSADETGEVTDDGNGFIAPPRVQKGDFFNVNTYDPAKPQIRVTGLPAGTYKVTMFGSLDNANSFDGQTQFRVNNASTITIQTVGNTSNAAVFSGINLSVGANLDLFFNPVIGGTTDKVGMLSFFTIEKTN